MSEQYVRHISGIGGRWLLHALTGYNRDQTHSDWLCVHRDKYGTLFLPKSEYQFCEPPPPPERWEDVTAECEAFEDDGFNGITHERVSRFQTTKWGHEDYRLRKVKLWTVQPSTNILGEFQHAFVVERKAHP